MFGPLKQQTAFLKHPSVPLGMRQDAYTAVHLCFLLQFVYQLKAFLMTILFMTPPQDGRDSKKMADGKQN